MDSRLHRLSLLVFPSLLERVGVQSSGSKELHGTREPARRVGAPSPANSGWAARPDFDLRQGAVHVPRV